MKQKISLAKLKRDYNYQAASAVSLNGKLAQARGTIEALEQQLQKENRAMVAAAAENAKLRNELEAAVALAEHHGKQRNAAVFEQNSQVKNLQDMLCATHQQIGYMTMQLGVMRQKLTNETAP